MQNRVCVIARSEATRQSASLPLRSLLALPARGTDCHGPDGPRNDIRFSLVIARRRSRRGPQGSAACGGVKRPQRLGRHLPLHKQRAGQRLSANPEISGHRRTGNFSRTVLPRDCYGPDGPRNDKIDGASIFSIIPEGDPSILHSSFFILHSHSTVAGGLLVMSNTTRLTPGTSLVMRPDAASSTS